MFLRRQFKLLVSVVSLGSLGLAALLPANATACWFGCCGGCGGGGGAYTAGRLFTPFRAGFGPRWMEAPVVVQRAPSGCNSCETVVSNECNSCSSAPLDEMPMSYGGECTPSTGTVESGAGTGPTPADPQDKWKKRTYQEGEAPLGGSRTDGSADSLRGGAGNAPATGTPETTTPPSRGGLNDEGESFPRSTQRPLSPPPSTLDTPLSPELGEPGEKIKIEPRQPAKPIPAPPEEAKPLSAPGTDSGTGSSRLGLPQASRLDNVTVDRETPARERTVARRKSSSPRLNRVREYARTPWAEEATETIARNP